MQSTPQPVFDTSTRVRVTPDAPPRRWSWLTLIVPLITATPASGQTGLMVVAHGANPEWNARVRETVAQVVWPYGPVAAAFLMGPEAEGSGWDQATTALVNAGSRQVVVVPLMVSSHGEHFQQLRAYAGEINEIPASLKKHVHRELVPPPVPMRVTPALNDAPELGQVLVARWNLLDSVSRHRPVVLVAHGPSNDIDAARWIADLSAVSQGMGAKVRIGLLRDDAAPPVRESAVNLIRDSVNALAAWAQDSVVVMPVMISTGDITQVKIPRDLAGLPIQYFPAPLAPSAYLARWIERLGRENLDDSAMESASSQARP